MKQKIAIIIPGGIGGGYFLQGVPALEDYIQQIAQSFDVTVYSMIKTDPAYRPKNFKVRHTGRPHTSSASLKTLLLMIIFIKDQLNNRNRLIHGIWGFPSGYMAVILGKIFRIPSIVSLQGAETAYVPQINYGHMGNADKREIMLWTCKHTDALTVLTNFQIKQLQKFGFARKDIYVIPYGADENVFTLSNKELQPPFRFIHMANLTGIKDQATLLRAFAIISKESNSSLRIIGDGEDMAKLKSLALDLGIDQRVEFAGATPHKKLYEHLHWAHIMLHTSLYEGQAVVVAEAAACGVVVCGTNVGLIADWGDDKCISVNCEDHEKLALEVLKLLNNPEKYRILRANASEWANKHTAAHTADSFHKLYSQLLK